MTEAVIVVTDWLMIDFGRTEVAWECVIGNTSSVSVARKAGFSFTGERATGLTFRDGSHPSAWHAVLRAGEPRVERPGWPT